MLEFASKGLRGKELAIFPEKMEKKNVSVRDILKKKKMPKKRIENEKVHVNVKVLE